MTVPIVCDGPGPHVPIDGIIGTADRLVTGMRCSSPACVPAIDPLKANANTLASRATAALSTNSTFLATVAARRTSIASGKSTAQTGTTATVTTTAQAQTQIRSIWTVLVQVATALDDLNNQAETIAKENNALIHLALGLLADISDSA